MNTMMQKTISQHLAEGWLILINVFSEIKTGIIQKITSIIINDTVDNTNNDCLL